MPTVELVRSTPIPNTFRVAKVQGMFDIPRRDASENLIHADLPLEQRDWQIGLITGASGSGKSSIARELWPDVSTAGSYSWTSDSLLDDFPDEMTPKQITDLLVSVGLSSSPVWLLPQRVLSTGQQFRADLARALASEDSPVVFDEFTSTVDRTVAKATSVAVSKHVRRSSSQFVAVTCHKDVEPWLQPDWVFDTDRSEFRWGSVQPRPAITLEIRAGLRSAWPTFSGHHYLSRDIAPSARVFLAYVTLGDDEQRLAGLCAVMPSAGHKGWRRGHRTVVLPDFQGLGIGNRLSETVAEQLWRRERLRFRSVTAAPGLIAHRRGHPEMWRLAKGPGRVAVQGSTSSLTNQRNAADRLTTSWVYIPEELRKKR